MKLESSLLVRLSPPTGLHFKDNCTLLCDIEQSIIYIQMHSDWMYIFVAKSMVAKARKDQSYFSANHIKMLADGTH